MTRTIAMAVSAAALAGCAVLAAPGGDAGNKDRFALIEQGMSQDQARRIMGAPDETMRFPLSNTEAWDYLNRHDAWGYLVSLSVTFGQDGRVVSKLVTRVNDGGDHGGK